MHDTSVSLQLAYPHSREAIRRDAYLLRSRLGLTHTPYFPVLPFLENVLPQIDPSFCLEVLDDRDLPGVYAEYIPSTNVIRVKSSVYEAAVSGHWLARSTLAHELGHYYYHDEHSVRYAKLDHLERVPPDFDPERQANVFAAELLAPISLIEGMSKEQIGKKFGVSYALAKRQQLALTRIRKRQISKRLAKRKRSSLQT